MPNLGDKIRVSDYNSIRNTFISFLTAGSGQTGYGQTANSSAVSTGNRVTRAQWANLVLDLNRMALHQGTSVGLPAITAGTKISASTVDIIQAAASTVVLPANLYNLAEFSDEPLVLSSRASSWDQTIRHFFTVTFSNADQARYFFNTGSAIRITPSFAKASATSINNNWETLINQTGTVIFGHTATSATGSSPGTVSSIGFYDLTTTPQQLYTKTGTGTYAANDYTIRASCNVTNNTTGTATTISFEVYFNDDKGPNPNFDEAVTGTVTNTVIMRRASGSNVSVIGPTAVNTVLL